MVRKKKSKDLLVQEKDMLPGLPGDSLVDIDLGFPIITVRVDVGKSLRMLQRYITPDKPSK